MPGTSKIRVRIQTPRPILSVVLSTWWLHKRVCNLRLHLSPVCTCGFWHHHPLSSLSAGAWAALPDYFWLSCRGSSTAGPWCPRLPVPLVLREVPSSGLCVLLPPSVHWSRWENGSSPGLLRCAEQGRSVPGAGGHGGTSQSDSDSRASSHWVRPKTHGGPGFASPAGAPQPGTWGREERGASTCILF